MTTWNSADKDAAVTLSGGDLVASGVGGVRGTTSKGSGKNSFSVSGDLSVGDIIVGTSLAGADRFFGDANAVGAAYFVSDGGWRTVTNGSLGASDGSSAAPTGTDVLVVHVDSGANRVYFTCNGNNLFGGNPAAGTGGITIPSGSTYPIVAVGVGPETESATADFTPGSLPSGYSDWDSSGGALSPSLFTNTNTFFAPSVVGPRELTPSLFTNSNSFFAPTVVNRGDLLGTLQVNANSITTSFAATGSVPVSIGDLVVSVVCQQTSLTVTGVTDNLGNTYTAQNAGTDAGAVTGRAFYSIVTTGGTLTSVTAACTGSTNDGVHIAAVFKGVFSAIDKNIANITSDVTSPFTCPSTGTLTQADEIVISWGVANHGTSWSTSSPSLQAIQLANSTTIKAAINYRVVAATSAISPAFTAGSNPTQAVLGTLTFSMATSATQNLTPNLFTNSQSFYGPTITTGAVDLAPSLVTNGQTFYGPTVVNLNTIAPSLVTNGQTFYAATITTGEVTLTPSLVTNTQTFFGPTVTAGEVTLSPSLYTNAQTFFGPVVSLGGVTLEPGLLTNTQTFYGPTVTAGAVDLAPSLFTNEQTFFEPTVTGGGTVFLLPELLVNDQVFFGPTVSLAVQPETVSRGGAYPWQEHRHKIGNERNKTAQKKKRKVIERAEEVLAEIDHTEDLEAAIAELDDKIEALIEAQTRIDIARKLKAVERSTAALLKKKAEDDADEDDALMLLF